MGRSPTFIYSDNILDLVLTSEGDRIGVVSVHPGLPGCGHCPLTLIIIIFDPFVPDSCRTIRRAWHHGDYGRIEGCPAEVDLDFEFFGLSLDEMLSRFHSILSHLVDLHVPHHEPKPQQAKFIPPRYFARTRQDF